MNTPTEVPGAVLHELRFKGGLLKRGFWLYVWEISAGGERYYYVGRTGDSSSSNAQSPFNRMGQHLGFRKQTNALRRCLEARGVSAEECDFRLVAFGPIVQEGQTHDEHRLGRDKIAPMEKALAEAMSASGYQVLNCVKCRLDLDRQAFQDVTSAFALHFPALQTLVDTGRRG